MRRLNQTCGYFAYAESPPGFTPDGHLLGAPRRGLEPLTLRLTAACSTIELPRITVPSHSTTGIVARDSGACNPFRRMIFHCW
jgi:hypothetical protein